MSTNVDSFQNRLLASHDAKLKQFPSKAISLFEIMQEISASNLICFYEQINDLIDKINNHAPGTRLTQKDVERIVWNINDSALNGDDFEKFGWPDVATRLGQLMFDLEERKILKGTHLKHPDFKVGKLPPFPTFDGIYHALFEFRRAFINVLDSKKFVMIDGKISHLFEEEELFGEKVWGAFPSARNEIRAAGSCLTINLNTAAVFHLMRAAELGMRALAIHLNVKLKGKPIEHGGWNEIIEQIEKKYRLRRDRYDKKRKKNKKELEFLKFCRMRADELFNFKDLRNDTMHSISTYNESEAKGIFDRVKDFMQRLSGEVSETK